MYPSVSELAAQEAVDALMHRLAELDQIGISLSQQNDITQLLENILLAAKKITNADGGTLYRCRANARDFLEFEIIRTDSLGIAMGGTTENKISLEPIRLRDAAGVENTSTVAAFAALKKRTVAIADVDRSEGFDFTGTKAFDQRTGYRSKSFLTVPLKNHEDEVIGVLQLINAKDRATGEIVAFSETDVRLAESLASQAAVVLTNRLLVLQLENLFESFVKLLNQAIDEKSPYTGGHCARVPLLTMLLAEAAHQTTVGPLAAWQMTDKDRYELKLAGMLHDCGKVTTPVHVVDKATKLQTIFDRIELLDTRFEVVKRDAELVALRAKLEANTPETVARIEAEFHTRLMEIAADSRFLHAANIGGERMTPADKDRVHAIAKKYRWKNPQGTEVDFLSENEIENLTIFAGTLTAAERQVINHHITVTIQMLEALPWPRHLQNVPEYAGGHHERMDGKGYPRGLTRDQMSVQARIMGIADIFEALTARDRPYKQGKTLTDSLHILGQMSLQGHIDPDLFDIFVRERVYLNYARQFLDERQVDDVDVKKIPGYSGD
ncbi:GAF and HD-GYP domain-containing protein [Oleiharenicola lentus]|uniref:GAF and HD-GYP domain-containing protein n=1 Tax=Oleiharenicola lentus TaxID=2508720 RepID=UPI003F66C3F7